MIRNKQRIFYPAGIISLICLPLLGIHHLQQKGAFVQKTAIEVAIYDSFGRGCTNINPYPREIKQDILFIDYLFNSNDQSSSVLLNNSKAEIALLSKELNPKKGIHFKVDGDAKFGTLITIWNACKTSKLNNIWAIKNDIWAFYDPRGNWNIYKLPKMPCGGRLYRGTSGYTTQMNNLVETKKALASFWMPLVLWIYMFWFAVITKNVDTYRPLFKLKYP